MCCGEEMVGPLGAVESEARRDAMVSAEKNETSERDDFMAAGIFRGEGHVGCHLNRRETRFGRHPELLAAVAMCDRDSIEIVARVFRSRVYHNRGGKCAGGTDAWQTRIFGVDRVKEVIGGWVARGLLRGEKMEQYFDALAKCRRARRIFLKEESRYGRPRQVF